MNRILWVLLISFSLAQITIETKQFIFFKETDINKINIMELIKENEGLFKVELMYVEDIKYERVKQILVLPCELEFNIASKISSKDIEYKLCKGKVISDNYIMIDKNKPFITISYEKFKYLSGNFISLINLNR